MKPEHGELMIITSYCIWQMKNSTSVFPCSIRLGFNRREAAKQREVKRRY